jgi:LuxR family maltose regulon positive regulatory protein
LLIAQGRSKEAIRLLESLVPVAEWRHRPGILIEIYTLQALACQAQGDLDRAVALLARALALAEPQNRVQVLLDEGEPIVRLLREAARRGVATAYVGKLLSVAGEIGPKVPAHAMPASAAGLVEPLSPRELEVLRMLDTHLTSTEIAERLIISVNTARYHIKNIYAKLDVHRRSDAVERARELRLL